MPQAAADTGRQAQLMAHRLRQHRLQLRNNYKCHLFAQKINKILPEKSRIL
jgi:hypothetical protein